MSSQLINSSLSISLVAFLPIISDQNFGSIPFPGLLTAILFIDKFSPFLINFEQVIDFLIAILLFFSHDNLFLISLICILFLSLYIL